jgi:GH25 family lysozyme M1 (1,4-beta-N-acetylmuramidase)
MAVLIGMASSDENGRYKNGKAGDQTGKEVKIRSWYSYPWNRVLRPKNQLLAYNLIKSCIDACNNPNIGYDQNQRLTLYNEAQKVNWDLSKISTSCECDCSSLIMVCCHCAGLNIKTDMYTGNERKYLMDTDMFDELTDSKYIASDKYLKAGDILINDVHHTAMALSNGDGKVSTTTENIGIDVSSIQGNINWSKVKSSGIKFVISRGIERDKTLDDKFEENYKGATEQGLPFGVYQFCYDLTVASTIDSAKRMVSSLKGKKIPIWLDLEWSSLGKLGKNKVTEIAKAYVNECKKLGYVCNIYSNTNWYKNYYNANELKQLGCSFWIASCPFAWFDNGTLKSGLKPNVGETIWQYSSKGKVNGISGDVDMNILYGDIDKIFNQKVTKVNTETKTSSSISIKNVVTASVLNVRKLPNASSTILTTLKKGSTVTITAYQNGWYGTTIGWVSSQYISTTKGKITASTLNYRASNNTSAKILGTFSNGEIVNLLNENNGWYLCQQGNKFGWCSGQYIK